MNIVGAFFILAGFVIILHRLKLISKGIEVAAVARRAFSDLTNSSLDDDTKGAAMQSHAKRLFTLFLFLSLGGALALVVPVGVIYVLGYMGILSFPAVIDTVVSWKFLVGTTLISFAVLLIIRNR